MDATRRFSRALPRLKGALAILQHRAEGLACGLAMKRSVGQGELGARERVLAIRLGQRGYGCDDLGVLRGEREGRAYFDAQPVGLLLGDRDHRLSFARAPP